MTIQFPISFTKMSGAGNDFILIDHRESFLTKEEKPGFVKQLCRRRFAVGADGIIFIENSDSVDFIWDFYNSDGSVAEMCGNGARCAARFAFVNGIAEKILAFETIAGIIEAEVLADDSVRLKMTDPFDFKVNTPIMLGDSNFEIQSVNTGVPHAIIFVDDEETPVAEWGRQVRFDDQFQPAGTNASFVTQRADGTFRSRTYERGVEEETRACGTGAVATALISAAASKTSSPVKVITSGLDELIISFELQPGPVAKNVFMQGPARIICEGMITAEAML